MFSFHEKRKLQRILYSRYFLGLMLIPIGFFSYAVFNVYKQAEETNEQKDMLQAELAALESRAELLEDDIVRLLDPYGQEAELRRRFEVGREGEEVIVLIEDGKEEDQGVLEEVPEPSFWERIKGWF